MTVVTVDHGNCVGERASPIPIREWGHPRGLYDEPFVRVPWFVHKQGHRRKIQQTAMGVTEKGVDSVEWDIVEERVRDLGYKYIASKSS